MSDLRNFNDLTLCEQYEALKGIKNLLVAALLKETHAGTVDRDRIPATVKHQLATHTPQAVNWNEAPTTELDAAAVVADVEAFLL